MPRIWIPICVLTMLWAQHATLRPAVATSVIRLLPDNQSAVQRGAALYKANCASCHGDNLEGEVNWRRPAADGRRRTPPHDETGHTWHHPDKFLFDVTKFGIPSSDGEAPALMPGYRDILSDAEIIEVLSFIKSTWPADLREYHDYLNSQSLSDGG